MNQIHRHNDLDDDNLDQDLSRNKMGHRKTNIIVKVAFTETEFRVRQKARDWLALYDDQYGVQQVIVIKIVTKRRERRDRVLKAHLFECNNPDPVEEVKFGGNSDRRR